MCTVDFATNINLRKSLSVLCDTSCEDMVSPFQRHMCRSVPSRVLMAARVLLLTPLGAEPFAAPG